MRHTNRFQGLVSDGLTIHTAHQTGNGRLPDLICPGSGIVASAGDKMMRRRHAPYVIWGSQHSEGIRLSTLYL